MKKSLISSIKIGVLAIACATPFAGKAIAFGDYAPVEHPFQYIGSGYTQQNGNAYCRQLYQEKVAIKNEFGMANNFPYINYSVGFVFSSDGTEISEAWHVWYHQVNGECVANK